MDASESETDDVIVTCDRSRMDTGVLHDFISNSYWGKGRTREMVERSFDGSLCFALLKGEETIGFGRVITDYVTFAYLADVFVLEVAFFCLAKALDTK